MAPRSMQATAVGIFYILEGSGNLFFSFFPPFMDTSTALTVFAAVSVGGNIVGLIIMIVLQNKLDLGLKRSSYIDSARPDVLAFNVHFPHISKYF